MKPGPDSDRYFAPDADAKSVRNLFGHIAGVYDFLNRALSFGLDAYWRSRLVRAANTAPKSPTGRILDLAAGTLEVSLALAARYPGKQIPALDFSLPMLQKGLPKLKKKKVRGVFPIQGDALALPLADASVDAVTIAFGLRNIRPREAAYAEALRVLTPGGRFCVLEFAGSDKSILFGLYNLYLKHVLPAVGALVSRNKGAYRYLADTIVAYPSPGPLEEEMRSAGFRAVGHTRYTFGIVCLHTGEKP
ncbi:ubiquinone/menaquinone biosynthesis methyltransferase [Desulfovibrio sp. OttesenSCG-928-M16]|nr:ubiquinone/menaquinone biosynthesis methyltransferase [Desulfovibrio sp. OttesenSCG-928-M16]